MRRSLMNVPNLGFGLALAVLGGIALLSYRNSERVAEAADARHRGSVRLDQLQEFLSTAVDVETGQRGYVVTGDEVFLAPYLSGMEQLEPRLQRLRVALIDDPRQQSALAQLEKMVTELIAYHRHVVALKASQDKDAAWRVIATGRGKQIMDQIRQLITALRGEEREQLQRRDREFQAGLHLSMFIIIAGSGLGFAAVALAAVAINWSLRERIRLNAELRQSLGENHAMLDQLRATGADLTRSNQELEQFAYIASHDLQEPLRKISSFAQLLASQYRDKLDAEANEFIGYMVDGAQRMQILIQNLLAYSRLGRKGRPFTLVDGDAVLKQALVNLQGAIEDSGAVVTSEPLPSVLADEVQLVQLFQNLIGNAIKFCGPAKPSIQIRAEATSSASTFFVRDHGIGIEPRFAERIFIIFQRLHSREEYPGTGIGLAFCKKIVERHGGRIWLESAPGQDTTFCFTLPHSLEKGGIPSGARTNAPT
jgi:signal transduction histidine kinase